MAVADKTLTVEVAVDPREGALVAYSDGVLDHATKLAVGHRTGNLSAEVVLEGERVVIRCGQVSREQAARLRGLGSVLWARLEGGRTVAIGELPLDHH